MLRTINALLFDLDDTLYSRDAAFRKWAQIFAREDLKLAEDDPHYQETIEQIVALDDGGYSSRIVLFSKIKEAHPLLLQHSVDQLLQTYNRRFFDYVWAGEETQGLLTALKGAGLPFGIITNGATFRQLRKINILGFDQLTSCIFVSEQFGCKKPDATIFLAAADCLGHEPGHILFVGDNPLRDIWGAHQVGMHTAWLHHQREWPTELLETPPDYVISSLSELGSLLGI